VAGGERLWIMVDVETSGPSYARHSLVELGAAVGSRARGTIDTFGALLRPTSAHVVQSRRAFEAASERGEPPAEAMARFLAWARPHLEARATFVARPASFDWPWIVHYAWTFLGENPFGFKAVCASSWFEARGERFRVDLPHVAERDAQIQLEHFLTRGLAARRRRRRPGPPAPPPRPGRPARAAPFRAATRYDRRPMDAPETAPLDDATRERVRASFARQGLLRTLRAELTLVERGRVDIRLPFSPEASQQHGYLHAAATSAVADSACGYAALTRMPPGSEVLSVEFKVNLLAPAAGAWFLASARVVRAGRTLTVTAADVFAHAGEGGAGKLVAVMTATMMRVEGAGA
jgi:uncharacterized protein (TIGR00369 family)